MEHVTEAELRAYIEAFHAMLDEISARFFTESEASKLLHNSLRPARIVCYASTQNGVAFEYFPAASTTVEYVRGTCSIEELVMQAPKAVRKLPPAFTVGANTRIGNLKINGAFPFRLRDKSSDVTLYDVRFSVEALGWQRDVKFMEVYGDRDVNRWQPDGARSRAKDEVLAALYIARNAQKKGVQLSEYIQSWQKRTVLLLGAYNAEGIRRLTAIAAALVQANYDPLLIKDVPEFEQYDLAQKVSVVGGLCRFVVIDDSMPSGHLMEFEICRQHRWPMVALHANGLAASWMTAGASVTSKMITELSYDVTDPFPAVSEGSKWIEKLLGELKEQFADIYPWRR
jgi:hypothetical protein